MTIEYEVQYDNGTDVFVFTGEADITMQYESDWGSDADGRGGIGYWTCTDFEIVSCYNEDGKEVKVADYLGLEDVIGEYCEKEAIENAEEY